MRDGDTLNWEIIKALMTQEEMLSAHVTRLRDKRDRYNVNTIAWAQENLELRTWELTLRITRTNLEAKTVAPS